MRKIKCYKILGALLFVLYVNNVKYAFSMKFTICLLALCCDIYYFKAYEWEELYSKSIHYSLNDFIVYDCLVSILYALYTKFSNSQTGMCLFCTNHDER